MRTIPESQITSMAPNANAVANARKLSRNGSLSGHVRSADDTYYAAVCSGSGSSTYKVSIDFIDESAPVCRCNCPSRQFPCKHSLALMFELLENRNWETEKIPQDILDKRARKEKREDKKEGKAEKTTKPSNKAARTKKLKKQLEGLDMAERVVRELMGAGLGTLNGNSLKTYRDLARQLGDYYLPGPERLVQSLILQIENMNTADDENDFREAIKTLVRLRALIKKSRAYLKEKLDQDQVEDDNSVLYEELGGIWTLDRLAQLGLVKENVRLLQLAFDEYSDESRKELVDKGWWLDIDSGEISVTCHYRPFKALKYVKEEDSVFDLVRVPRLIYYPGTGNRRIRWEGQEFEPATGTVLEQAAAQAATSLAAEVKSAKNEIKNTLSDGRYGCLLKYSQIVGIKREDGTSCVLQDQEGGVIELRDRPGDTKTTGRLAILPDSGLLKDHVIFGILWYDGREHKICMQPYSIITEDRVIRLLY